MHRRGHPPVNPTCVAAPLDAGGEHWKGTASSANVVTGQEAVDQAAPRQVRVEECVRFFSWFNEGACAIRNCGRSQDALLPSRRTPTVLCCDRGSGPSISRDGLAAIAAP